MRRKREKDIMGERKYLHEGSTKIHAHRHTHTQH